MEEDSEKMSDIEMIHTLIKERFPDMAFVPISDIEDENHQSYKFLYEKFKGLYEQMEKEFHSSRFVREGLEKEVSELSEKLEKQMVFNERLKNSTENMLDSIKDVLDRDIMVSNIKALGTDGQAISLPADQKKEVALEDLSLNLGVYGFRRASFFSPLKRELNKLNVAKKNVQGTQGMLKEKVSFWKKLFHKIDRKEITVMEASDIVDETRRKKVHDLLNGQFSNEEKFIKYLLLTPALPKDFLSTLMGAAEIGVDANTVIMLLEQPEGAFNKEIIVEYVSKVHKATEYNLKQELAEELIRGEWYVVADMNGINQKFQMVPFDVLNDIRSTLDNVYDVLSGNDIFKGKEHVEEMLAEERADEEFSSDFDLPEDIEVEENFYADLDEELKDLI